MKFLSFLAIAASITTNVYSSEILNHVPNNQFNVNQDNQCSINQDFDFAAFEDLINNKKDTNVEDIEENIVKPEEKHLPTPPIED